MVNGIGVDVMHRVTLVVVSVVTWFTEVFQLHSAALLAMSGSTCRVLQWSAGVCEVHVAGDGRLYARLSRSPVHRARTAPLPVHTSRCNRRMHREARPHRARYAVAAVVASPGRGRGTFSPRITAQSKYYYYFL